MSAGQSVPPDRDSLAPLLTGAARSQRLAVFARWVGPLLLSGLVVPGFNWVTTRYDQASAERLTARVTVIERVTGLPAAGTGEGERALRDRVTELEGRIADWDQAQLKHDHDVFANMVRVHAATGERNPALRAAAAREAVTDYERACNCFGEVGSPKNPYHCSTEPALAARAALETSVPGR